MNPLVAGHAVKTCETLTMNSHKLTGFGYWRFLISIREKNQNPGMSGITET